MFCTGGVEYGDPVVLEKMKDMEDEEGEMVVDLVRSIRGHAVALVQQSTFIWAIGECDKTIASSLTVNHKYDWCSICEVCQYSHATRNG